MPGRSRPFAAALGLAGCVLAFVAPAAAQDSERAEELISRANEFRRRGQDSSALPLLRQAYRLTRTPRTAAQLGLAESALGYWLEAEQHLAESLAPESHPWIDRHRKALDEVLNNTRAHLGTLIVEGRPSGAEVRVNGKLIGNLPSPPPIRVPEGEVTVEVRATQYRADAKTVRLGGKATERVSFDLFPDIVPTTKPAPKDVSGVVGAQISTKAPSPTDGQQPAWRRGLPFTLVGVAVLAAGFGVWQHVTWQNGVTAFDAIEGCGVTQEMRGSDARCAGLYEKYSAARLRAFIGYGFAGALGLGASAMFLVNRSSDQAQAVGPGHGLFGVAYAGVF